MQVSEKTANGLIIKMNLVETDMGVFFSRVCKVKYAFNEINNRHVAM